ncbi:ring domain [Cryptosporidium canis]|uniref:Ring domain n=1 Tax=Cryptosporidium canis TaxID=195482 RepID=A0A9D5DHM9_9CRYT|nr:ring domain [Cryptosporidium canis]
MAPISKKVPFYISNKLRFIQQNYRVFLLKDCKSARSNSSIPQKKIVFEWGDVGLIDLIYFDSDEFIKCPICLESDLLVPKISNCGHVYCWPCIIRLINSILGNDECAKKFKCPICFSNVFFNELVSLRYQIVQKVQLGSEVNLCLLFRYISSQFVHFDIDVKSLDKNILLEKSEMGIQFQRVGQISDLNDVLLCDLQMLRIRRHESEMNDLSDEIYHIDECISIIEGTLGLNGVDIPKYETPSNDSFNLLLSDYSESRLLDELGYRFICSLDSNTVQNNIKDMFYFYQLFDGQFVFLEPFCVQVLLTEFGSIQNLPKVLLNVQVLSMREFVLDSKSIRRYKFLSHIPYGSTIYIIGIDIKQFITPKTTIAFKDELERRQRKMINNEEARNIDLRRNPKTDDNLIDQEAKSYNPPKRTILNSSSNGYMSSSSFPTLTNHKNGNVIRAVNSTNHERNIPQEPEYRNKNEEKFPLILKTNPQNSAPL